MTAGDKAKVVDLYARRHGIRKIARMLGVHPYSVRWVLQHEGLLERAKKKRREAGMAEYRCSSCNERGHNRRTCTK